MLRLLKDDAPVNLRLGAETQTNVLPQTGKEWGEWPDAVAYREAVQNPATALDGNLISRPSLALDRRGMPLAYTGRFAIVFRVADGAGQNWAVRCFTTSPQTRGEDAAYRFNTLGSALSAPAVRDLFVPFRYAAHGFTLGTRKFPVLAMQWGQGEALGRFVERNLQNPAALLALAASLGDALDRLNAARIAHGDWQHDNILVSDGGRRVTFVDYDGVYIDTLADTIPQERGHPNYNLPTRSELDYGPDLDRFPCLLMQTALAFLAVEPSLYDSFCDGDNLLFHQADLEAPGEAPVFAALRLVAEHEPEPADLLTRFAVACETGIVGDTVPRTVFEAVAKRHKLTLHNSEGVSEPSKTTVPQPEVGAGLNVPRPRGMHGALSTQAAPSAFAFNPTEAVPLAEVAHQAPRHTSETRIWFDNIRRKLKRQEVADRVHRTLMWSFLLGMFVWFWIASANGGDAFAALMTTWFLTPAGIAVGYFLWPRNQGWLEVTAVKQESEKKLSDNLTELRKAREQLYAINRQPANLSTVAFVASALQAALIQGVQPGSVLDGKIRYGGGAKELPTWLQPLAETAPTFTADEMRLLLDANIFNLGDVTPQALAALPPTLEERLLAAKQALMQAAARDGYEEVARQRRDTQKRAEELEQERSGLLEADKVLANRLARIGSISFGRFLGYLFGF